MPIGFLRYNDSLINEKPRPSHHFGNFSGQVRNMRWVRIRSLLRGPICLNSIGGGASQHGGNHNSKSNDLPAEILNQSANSILNLANSLLILDWVETIGMHLSNCV